MKKPTLLTALLTALLTLLAIPAFPAIQYDFVQRTTHEGVEIPTSELHGRTTLDGNRSRIEFTGGDVYPSGTYLVSVDGSRRLYFVDPENKWYTEVNTAGIATAVAASNIQIANLKSDVEKVAEGEVIAGHSTDHYKLTITYDITVPYRSMPLKQSVRTVIHTWASAKFGDVGRTAFSNTIRTGNPEVDQLVEAETTKVHGLPLRQSITITTTNTTGRPVKSNLPLPPSRTITRETWITRIGEALPDAMTFKIPASYRKSDQPDTQAPPMTILDMQPVTK